MRNGHATDPGVQERAPRTPPGPPPPTPPTEISPHVGTRVPMTPPELLGPALATKHLRDRIVVLHTDAAKSYKPRMSGVLHDHVRHCKKRVKVKGKWMWKLPTYVRVTTHKDPKTGRKFKTKGGTQIIDRAWRFLKDRIHLNQHCRVGTPLLRAKIRSAQYEYWHRNADLWLQTGIVCTWHVAKSLA